MRVRLPIRRIIGIAASAMLSLLCAASLTAQTIRIPTPKPRTGIAIRNSLHPASLLGGTVLSLSASPTSVNFTLVANGSATANNAIAVTSTLTLPLSTSIRVYGYFVSSTAALTGTASGSHIPTSAVYGIMPTGVPTSYTAFTQTGPFGGSSSSLLLVSLNGIAVLYSETDNLTLKINLSGVAIPADTYVGTLYIQGQAF
jgi:hypothetical protein